MPDFGSRGMEYMRSHGLLNQPVSRPSPRYSPDAYKTYGMSMPLRTHWRKATCAEVWCQQHLNGWVTVIDVSDSDGRERAQFILADKERHHTVVRTSPTTFEFTFPPGQRCYLSDRHILPLGRQPILYVRGGDYRAATGDKRLHSRVEDWVEDSGNHLDQLRTRLARG